MKVALLSRSARVYSSKRLAAACRRLGHSAVHVDPMACVLHLSDGSADLLVDGRSVRDAGVVIPRFGSQMYRHGMVTLVQFEQAGVPTVNPSAAIARSRDKLATLQHLIGHGIPMAPTAFATRAQDVRTCLDLVGGPPVVIKSLDGPPGRGMMLARTADHAVSLVEGLALAHQPVLIQQFLPGARDGGGRALVVGEEVVAAVRRQVDVSDDEATSRQVPRLVRLDPSQQHEDLSLAACKVLGLSLAFVDWVETPAGPSLIEVNAAPSLEAIEAITDLDLATAIVDFALSLATSGRSG